MMLFAPIDHAGGLLFRGGRRRISGIVAVTLALSLWPGLPGAHAADLETTRQLLRTGEYARAITEATAAWAEAPPAPEAALLLAEGLRETGRVVEARQLVLGALERFPSNLELRLTAYHLLRETGAAELATRQLEELERISVNDLGFQRSPAERVAFGRIALLFGVDPKLVIEKFFEPARQESPDFRGSYLAVGELALEKNDFALAAKKFGAATRRFPDDADAWFGLARAFSPSDAEKATEALTKTLQLNPRHVAAYLLLTDHHIDRERYGEADRALAAALQVDPQRPEAHAYRAVLAHLRADAKTEAEARATALRPWPRNPAVPQLIGRKLSQKYRFAEGAALQREALQFDPAFLPASAQLATDLLRLGRDEEGWALAETVQKADPYDVVAYNLVTLRDAMAGFKTLTTPHFLVRMEPREAEVYGVQVLALLERAHALLTRKYGLEPKERTIVEIFPDQKDFAIRTFGLPGGDGYLGVCFGRVITANSPAARPGSPTNWESVLWHEFTHVVTLTLTKNKMPRWLSEGISVYEERQARGSWGEQMKPRYRAMILSEDLTPVSQLSASFLQPKTPAHLGFAYYESSLVVEWLSERWGLEKVKKLLADLARGVEINAALATHFLPIEKLDAEFAAHARERARQVGPRLDWTPPPPEALATAETRAAWVAANPDNFTSLTSRAEKLIAARSWAEAKAPLQRLLELYPNQHEADSAYAQLARVHHELGETDAELALLTRLADLADNATEVYARLAQVAAEHQEWPKVLDYTRREEAVNPLRPAPHRLEAEALEATGGGPAAIAAWRTLLRLEPPNPAEVHFRLAKLLHAGGEIEPARRQVLMALEEAPRFRAAHELLRQIPEPIAPAAHDRRPPAGPGRAQAQAMTPSFHPLPPPLPGPWRRRRLRRVGLGLLGLALLTGGLLLAQRPNRFRARVPDTTPPAWQNEPGFEKDVFTFARIQYHSVRGYGRSGGNWSTDYPDADLNLLHRLQQMTSLKVYPQVKVLPLTDPELFRLPFIYIVEPGRLSFEDDEVPILRKYLLNGGFLMIDDFWGDDEWENLETELKRVFPDRQITDLPRTHPIFHCVFDIPNDLNLQLPSIEWAATLRGTGRTFEPNKRYDTDTNAHIRGLFDDQGRLCVIMCHNTDNGDGWEREGEDEYYFREFSEKKAYPLGINIIFYAMTH